MFRLLKWKVYQLWTIYILVCMCVCVYLYIYRYIHIWFCVLFFHDGNLCSLYECYRENCSIHLRTITPNIASKFFHIHVALISYNMHFFSLTLVLSYFIYLIKFFLVLCSFERLLSFYSNYKILAVFPVL